MVISHYGLGMVKVQLGERVIVFNPIGKSAEGEAPKFGADLALVALNDGAYNGVEQVSRGERVPFVINGPGEYELGGDFVRGFATTGPSGKINTVYLLVLDGLRLVHLGALATPELAPETVEQLGAIDILFMPIDNDLLGSKPAAKLANTLGARVVVPVNASKLSLAAFLKEMGEEGNGAAVPSWTVKRKDLADKEGEVVVIDSL